MNPFERYKLYYKLSEQNRIIEENLINLHKNSPDITIFAYNSYLTTTENLSKDLLDTIRKVCGRDP